MAEHKEKTHLLIRARKGLIDIKTKLMKSGFFSIVLLIILGDNHITLLFCAL